jgi:hypothetical protein
MDLSNTPAPATVRHDGWTPERRTQFLDRLAQDGNVCAACALVGLSREAAYRLRRREPLFARAWAAAQVHARESVGEVLGTRAIEGLEEQIWHRGEVVGTRRRYDTRPLLAHRSPRRPKRTLEPCQVCQLRPWRARCWRATGARAVSPAARTRRPTSCSRSASASPGSRRECPTTADCPRR